MGIIDRKLENLKNGSSKVSTSKIFSEEEKFKAKYGGDLRPVMYLNKSLDEGQHRYFDSADWSMNKEGQNKLLSDLPHKVKPTQPKPKTPRKMVLTKHMMKTDSAREWFGPTKKAGHSEK